MSLVLVDLGLAEDGVALVRALRRRRGQPLPVVVFSGIGDAGRPGAGAVGDERRGLRQRAREHAADSAGARAASLSGQLQPTGQRADRARRAGHLSGRPDDCGRGDARRRQGRTGDPDDESAAARGRPFRSGSGCRAATRTSTSPAASPGAIARSGMGVQFEQVSANDQRIIDDVRRRASVERRLLTRTPRSSRRLFAVTMQGRAGVGEDRHPQRRQTRRRRARRTRA